MPGVGLALDRPLQLLRRRSWARWGATWRLLLVSMPLCILGVALLGGGSLLLATAILGLVVGVDAWRPTARHAELTRA